MLDSVKKFLQEPVKKYACGEKARQTLQNTFTASSAEKAADEKRLLGGILETLNKTDSGRETLEALSDLGYRIKFQNLGKQFGGYCNYDDRVIVLNPTRSKNFLAVAVVHEGRHGIQFASEKENAPIFEQTRVADMYRMRKAIEADACAHQSAFAYECKDIAPEVYAEQKRDYPMLTAYETELEKTGDKKKAMQAAFKSWYDFPYYRDLYDEYYKDNGVKAMAEIGKRQKDPTFFSKDYPVKDVVDLCLYRGKPYMTADYLNSDKPNALTAEAKKEIKAVLADYAKSVAGAKRDTSVDKMATRDKDGKILEPAKMRSNAAVLAKAARGRGD
ncbi:MAG TPA: hypothetical protein DCX19_01625 [Alphaproteobacteria bacterium]|nr:hypothetical protein [Alphaproteobacteria bacterium]